MYLIILKFGTENDEQKEFLQKVVFIYEKLKFGIFRRITFSANYYLPGLNDEKNNVNYSKNRTINFLKVFT